jgi:ribose transport system permease protein
MSTDTSVVGSAAPRGWSPGGAALRFTSRFGAVVALLLLIVLFTVLRPEQFLSSANIVSILGQVAVVGIMALGLTATLIMLEFDLSIGWVGSLAGMLVCGWMANNGMPVPLAILLALAVGAGIGLANGLVVTGLGVNAFIGTLAMGSVVSGAISWYSISPISAGIPVGFSNIGQGKVLGIPGPVFIMVAVAIVLYVLFEKMVPGRKMYAIGGNSEAARLSGVPIDRYRILAFMISGVCAAAAGIVLASSLASGQPLGATGFLLDAFAAVFLGAATWRDGEFHIGGTLVGVLIIGVIFNGLSLLDAPAWSKDVMRGSILILAVGASGILRRTRA